MFAMTSRGLLWVSVATRIATTAETGIADGPSTPSSGIADFSQASRSCDFATEVCTTAALASSSVTKAHAETVSAVERLARADRRHAATAEEWDRDPWALNTPGGVVERAVATSGGIGSLPGAMLGGLLIGLIETFWAAYFTSEYKDVAAFSILIVVLIFLPTGLLGRPEVEKV